MSTVERVFILIWLCVAWTDLCVWESLFCTEKCNNVQNGLTHSTSLASNGSRNSRPTSTL